MDEHKIEFEQRIDFIEEYHEFIHKRAEVKQLLNGGIQLLDPQKTNQALDIFKREVVRLANLPGFLPHVTSINFTTGQPLDVDVLCMEPLIQVHISGKTIVPCLFKDGLYLVEIEQQEYLFSHRAPITDNEFMNNIDEFTRALYFRTLQLSEANI